MFEPIYVMGGGAGEAGDKFGPNDSGMTMVPLVYHTGFETFEMGKSTAIAPAARTRDTTNINTFARSRLHISESSF